MVLVPFAWVERCFCFEASGACVGETIVPSACPQACKCPSPFFLHFSESSCSSDILSQTGYRCACVCAPVYVLARPWVCVCRCGQGWENGGGGHEIVSEEPPNTISMRADHPTPNMVVTAFRTRHVTLAQACPPRQVPFSEFKFIARTMCQALPL